MKPGDHKYFIPAAQCGRIADSVFFVQYDARQPARETILRDKSTRFNHRIDRHVKPFSAAQSIFSTF